MAHNTGIGQSSIGQAVAGAWDNTIGMGGIGLTGQGGALNTAWNAMTGQIEPEDLQYANWENQQYDPNWNLDAQTWDAQGYDALGYTGQGYDAQGYTGQGYTASQLGAAQGYNANQLGAAQGYDATGYTAQGYDPTTGTYQAGEDFSNILGQAMGAATDFMDPSSDWARGQQAIVSEQAGQLAGQTQAQQSAQLAARGMGSGGLRSLLGGRAQAEAGAQARQGATDIATAGAGLGLQALGQAGSMATAQEQNILQQSLANQAAQNQASQFGAAAQNQAASQLASAQNQASQFGAGAQNQFSLANQAAMNQAAQFGAGQQNQFSLSNQAAQNAASAFGAQAANTANQWSAGQQNQAAQFGADAMNTANQWSTGQQNLANQWNTGQQNLASQWNANAMNQMNQFNVGNQMNWDSWNASQGFAADQFNASQFNAQMQGNVANNAGGISGGIQLGGAVAAKIFFACIPEGTKIDTPDGSIPIEDLKSGDIVNGYGSKPVAITQKHEYKENPEPKRFLKIYFDDGDTIDLCDMHRIKGIRSREYNVGDSINGKEIINIKWYGGVTRSYDLLTEDKGYRISGVPVDSMIEEMNTMISLLKEVK